MVTMSTPRNKSVLLVKESKLDEAKVTFEDQGVCIQSEGTRYLGGAIGDHLFCGQVVDRQVGTMVEELHKLSDIAKAEPQAVYAALTHGWFSKWNHVLRTTDWDAISPEALQPLEDCLCNSVIPSLTGQSPCTSRRHQRPLVITIPAGWSKGTQSCEDCQRPVPYLQRNNSTASGIHHTTNTLRKRCH